MSFFYCFLCSQKYLNIYIPILSQRSSEQLTSWQIVVQDWCVCSQWQMSENGCRISTHRVATGRGPRAPSRCSRSASPAASAMTAMCWMSARDSASLAISVRATTAERLTATEAPSPQSAGHGERSKTARQPAAALCRSGRVCSGCGSSPFPHCSHCLPGLGAHRPIRYVHIPILWYLSWCA